MKAIQGIYLGVKWVKTTHPDIRRGFTTVIVDGEEVHFHGHTSNARAWNFIDKHVPKRGFYVSDGQIITKRKGN